MELPNQHSFCFYFIIGISFYSNVRERKLSTVLPETNILLKFLCLLWSNYKIIVSKYFLLYFEFRNYNSKNVLVESFGTDLIKGGKTLNCIICDYSIITTKIIMKNLNGNIKTFDKYIILYDTFQNSFTLTSDNPVSNSRFQFHISLFNENF